MKNPLSIRGVKSWHEASKWLNDCGIEDIECITPDLAGVPRGKMMPSSKFTSNTSLALPSAIYRHTISGEYMDSIKSFHHEQGDGDLKLAPDLSTLSVVPWETDPTAQVICDVIDYSDKEVLYTPRNVLKRVLELYKKNSLNPIIAPEIEFYLIAKNEDPDDPLHPPKGRSGRSILGGQSYSIAGINEFDELIDDIWDFSEKQGLEIDTLIHEEGPAQFEINLRHGNPLILADQVFLLKRTIREAALKHNIYATFMAKPMQNHPGSAMHVHQSVLDSNGYNIFSNQDGSETDMFKYFIGGMQRYMPNALVMLAPYVNSYRRLTPDMACPVNTAWGYDNRTTAFRIPFSDATTRRIENRLPSSDTNPYLALAASLACGLLGILQKVAPTAPTNTSANRGAIDLPRGLLEAVALLEKEPYLKEIFGSDFINIYAELKRSEFETFMQVISPWEREFLLLNV
ncbi:glutamine synthetase family protein [Liberibacter crescens BT-1]|uniref:Glutamine synthetase family protein n=1 Tax=Liberibacter crescens (strain BT-1) TaxID=1215343 RepID=L0EVG2_LIBCB|nr:glutamine synthetase family protein [Liberibacter crescens]AGA64386.1 glutamine synthetase family protein [Liberibacter crescens BT-1]AMC12571.1 glutamine synthetase [Liberibacter crescens]